MWFYKIIVITTISWCQLSGSIVNGQQVPPGGYYTTRYDHIDIEHILNQKRLVNYYADCLLDRGPCTPQGVEFKKILPEALKTNCLRCTEKQRFVTIKSIRRLKKEYPDVWSQLASLWDPNGEYVEQLENSYKNRNSPSEQQNFNNQIEVSSVSPNVQLIPASIPKAPKVIPTTISTSSTMKPTSSVTPVVLLTRFGDDTPEQNINPINNVAPSGISNNNNNIRSSNNNNNNNNINQPELLPTPKLQVQPVTANTIANKPISFSSTTLQPVIATTKSKPSTTFNDFTMNSFKTTTKRIISTILQDKFAPTTHRVSYNYDFSVTIKPLVTPNVNNAPINMVIQGVNNIIQPITDIAGKVITAGTDIAGIVLNALGVRRTA